MKLHGSRIGYPIWKSPLPIFCQSNIVRGTTSLSSSKRCLHATAVCSIFAGSLGRRSGEVVSGYVAVRSIDRGMRLSALTSVSDAPGSTIFERNDIRRSKSSSSDDRPRAQIMSLCVSGGACLRFSRNAANVLLSPNSVTVEASSP